MQNAQSVQMHLNFLLHVTITDMNSACMSISCKKYNYIVLLMMVWVVLTTVVLSMVD